MRRVQQQSHQRLRVGAECIRELLDGKVDVARVHHAAFLDDEHVHLHRGHAVAPGAHQERHVRGVPVVVFVILVFFVIVHRDVVLVGRRVPAASVGVAGGRRAERREGVQRAGCRGEGRDATAVVGHHARGRGDDGDGVVVMMMEPGDRDGGCGDGRTRADPRRRCGPSGRAGCQEHGVARDSRR